MFHHLSGVFPIAASRYHVTVEAIACEVAIGAATHRVVLIGADAQRFTRAVIAADQHIRWHRCGLPRSSTLYEVETTPAGAVRRVSWWWHDQDGTLGSAPALAFLRSAGDLRVCEACNQERIVPPELMTPIYSGCGFYATDSGGRSLL